MKDDIVAVKEREVMITCIAKAVSLRSGFKDDTMDYLLKEAKKLLCDMK